MNTDQTIDTIIQTLPAGVPRGKKIRHPFHSQSSVLVHPTKRWTDFLATGAEAIAHMDDLLGEPCRWSKPDEHPYWRVYDLTKKSVG